MLSELLCSIAWGSTQPNTRTDRTFDTSLPIPTHSQSLCLYYFPFLLFIPINMGNPTFLQHEGGLKEFINDCSSSHCWEQEDDKLHRFLFFTLECLLWDSKAPLWPQSNPNPYVIDWCNDSMFLWDHKSREMFSVLPFLWLGLFWFSIVFLFGLFSVICFYQVHTKGIEMKCYFQKPKVTQWGTRNT